MEVLTRNTEHQEGNEEAKKEAKKESDLTGLETQMNQLAERSKMLKNDMLKIRHTLRTRSVITHSSKEPVLDTPTQIEKGPEPPNRIIGLLNKVSEIASAITFVSNQINDLEEIIGK